MIGCVTVDYKVPNKEVVDYNDMGNTGTYCDHVFFQSLQNFPL